MFYRLFDDRADAGRRLAAELAHVPLNNPIVLGLPRGGVPVAFEVATALSAPLDIVVVRKLGAPFQPELALGAIASGGVRVMNEEDTAGMFGVDPEVVDEIAARELAELERRESLYRGNRPAPDLEQRDVILIDDGLATGASMRAAAQAVRA
ncbi:MAG TPA: phosphoribosyltransferase family protein, partial [Woeseiaceae bacterium]|nr:phosphoribosyltransferase family protein [Woeseiaceae bacterium]